LMHEFCVGLRWCGCIMDDKPLHVTDFISETGPVSADEFARWLIMADSLDPPPTGPTRFLQKFHSMDEDWGEIWRIDKCERTRSHVPKEASSRIGSVPRRHFEQRKTALLCKEFWRSGRDSNPRYEFLRMTI
jgi:hypothetical protein